MVLNQAMISFRPNGSNGEKDPPMHLTALSREVRDARQHQVRHFGATAAQAFQDLIGELAIYHCHT